MRLVAAEGFRPTEQHAMAEWLDAQTDCRDSRYVWHSERRTTRLPGGVTVPMVYLIVRQRED
jgi:hypothetical protein